LAVALTHWPAQVEGGWILNGRKRWIGNATFADIIVYWARNTTTKEINAFVVRKGTKGLRTSKIENKISLRCVQNANIFLDDCFVRDCDRLPGVDSFKVPPPPPHKHLIFLPAKVCGSATLGRRRRRRSNYIFQPHQAD